MFFRKKKKPMRLAITNGPGKKQLAEALFGWDKDHQPRVSFQIGDGVFPWYIISEVKRLDVADEKWRFKGCKATGKDDTLVSGEYSTKTRTGWMELGEPL